MCVCSPLTLQASSCAGAERAGVIRVAHATYLYLLQNRHVIVMADTNTHAHELAPTQASGFLLACATRRSSDARRFGVCPKNENALCLTGRCVSVFACVWCHASNYGRRAVARALVPRARFERYICVSCLNNVVCLLPTASTHTHANAHTHFMAHSVRRRSHARPSVPSQLMTLFDFAFERTTCVVAPARK